MNKATFIIKICVLSLGIYLLLNTILNLDPMRGLKIYLIALIFAILAVLIIE